MKKTVFIINFLLLLTSLSAQQIYFCKSYTQDGQPIDADIRFSIEQWGSPVYLLLDNEKKAFDDNLLYVFIDKNMNGSFQPFDSKVIRVADEDTWAVINYKFKEVGEYVVYFMDSKQKKLAEDNVFIKLKDLYSNQNKIYSKSYYDNCQLVFCERVIAEKPINIKTSMSVKQNQGEVFVYLSCNKSINTEKILLDIWKKKNSTFEYDQFVESKKYKVTPEWTDTFFKYKFKEVGEYKFTLFNQNELPIGSIRIKVY